MKFFFSFFLMASYGGLAVLSAQVASMQLKQQEMIVGNSLTLNDLLDSSQGLTPEELAMTIAPAPSLGNSATWSREQIATVLPTSLQGRQIGWTGATSCLVKRPAAIYGETEVRRLILAELAKHVLPTDEFGIMKVVDVDPFPIPDGDSSVEVDLSPGTLRNEWGEATLRFRSEGQMALVKNVRFEWSCVRPVWETAKNVNGGAILSPDSFQQVQTDILEIPGSLQPMVDFPKGKVAAHLLQEGKILMQNDWVEPTLVKNNDLVTILYKYKGISITLQAKALESGVRDDVIRVENISSQKIFSARVVDERTLVYDE